MHGAQRRCPDPALERAQYVRATSVTQFQAADALGTHLVSALLEPFRRPERVRRLTARNCARPPRVLATLMEALRGGQDHRSCAMSRPSCCPMIWELIHGPGCPV